MIQAANEDKQERQERCFQAREEELTSKSSPLWSNYEIKIDG